MDLNALEENYRTIRAFLASKVRILCVVKADAYGHGAVEVARRLESNDVDYLGVATVDEGLDLRESGISVPILVMSGIFAWDDVASLFTNRLTPVVYDRATLERIEEEGLRHDEPLRVHVKVDTGMGRLGFAKDDLPFVAERIKEMKGVKLEGLMSHFSQSEKRDEYGMNQMALFMEALQSLRAADAYPEIIHMANSGAITTYPEAHFSMVRVGINLYGSYPAEELRERMPLRQVMRLASRVAVIREFPEGTALSYGRTYTTKKGTRVAYIPVGYADGYPRSLSNKGSVLIKGKRCSIIGRICMDWFLADITYLEGVEVGDEVVLLGRGDGQLITADEIAEQAGTIPYEILCGISRRIMRVYV